MIQDILIKIFEWIVTIIYLYGYFYFYLFIVLSMLAILSIPKNKY